MQPTPITTNKPTVTEPLLTEIFNETFSRLSASDKFDAGTITRLKAAANRGDMKKPAQAILALKTPVDEQHEDSRA